MAIPVIIVLNHNWHLYFAVDYGNHIKILQANMSIGDTSDLIRIYCIVAVFRRLGKWGVDVFEPWVKTAIGLA
ncbi:hypothetical protein M501DRAFT_1055020 [Patellaria atrata CBS 101060]|uniref:PD-(D/E)XK nuclease-like domain-containing protein n=1 Tax=Patellaria atrata CBS 101060 TaxID=1346257 RepID=A0A9P4VSR3_9PEZI|nr:hypothetical protein M501DRAFT_1055020 [Patellaria atrata CBS 101060]